MKDNTVREKLVNELLNCSLCHIAFAQAGECRKEVEELANFILVNYIPKSAIEPLKEWYSNPKYGPEDAIGFVEKTLTNCGEKI